MRAKRTENGSVFFYILLAVVLFAALAFTVSRSLRGSNTNALSERQAEIAANEIMDYSAQISREVDRLRRKGISESDLDFSSNLFSRHSASPPSSWDINPNCGSTECKIFQSAGGKMHETTFEQYATEHTLPTSNTIPRHGHPAFYRISALDHGSVAEDLTLQIIRVRDLVCAAINEKLNLGTPSTLTQEAAGSSGQTAEGGDGYWNYSDTQTTEPLFDEATALQGKVQGCVRMGGDYGNVYFKVLLER